MKLIVDRTLSLDYTDTSFNAAKRSFALLRVALLVFYNFYYRNKCPRNDDILNEKKRFICWSLKTTKVSKVLLECKIGDIFCVIFMNSLFFQILAHEKLETLPKYFEPTAWLFKKTKIETTGKLVGSICLILFINMNTLFDKSLITLLVYWRQNPIEKWRIPKL